MRSVSRDGAGTRLGRLSDRPSSFSRGHAIRDAVVFQEDGSQVHQQPMSQRQRTKMTLSVTLGSEMLDTEIRTESDVERITL